MQVEREMLAATGQEPAGTELGREKFIDRKSGSKRVKYRGNIIGQLKRLGSQLRLGRARRSPWAVRGWRPGRTGHEGRPQLP